MAKPPPWIHTRTGRPDVSALPSAGVYTFRYRQSSSNEPGGAKGPACCGQLDANSVASRTPSHAGAGCGACHRNGPVGGAAYGTPRNTKPPSTATPPTEPPSVSTTGSDGELAARTPLSTVAAAPASGDDEGRRCSPAGDEPATLKVSGHGAYSFGLDGQGGRSWSVRSGTDRLDRFAMRMGGTGLAGQATEIEAGRAARWVEAVRV